MREFVLMGTGFLFLFCSCPESSQAPGQVAVSGDVTPTPVKYSVDLPPFRTKLVMLGTGTPNPDPERSGPAVAVVVDDEAYVVDCGAGVVRRAAAAFLDRGVVALAPERLDTVFITHLHSDHTLGYPDLILTPWVSGRGVPLEAYGPPGLKRMTDNVLAAWAEDIDVRVGGIQPNRDLGHGVNVHEVVPGEIYRDDKVKVEAFPVLHGAWEHSYGYKFTGPDRTIVISGDTRPTEEIARVCDGCDILVHEVYSQAGFDGRSPDWQAYHRASHTSTGELAKIAMKARPGLLVLYHQLRWGGTEEGIVKEVKAGWDGEVVYADDLNVY